MILVVPIATLFVGIYLIIARTRFIQIALGVQVTFLSLGMIAASLGVVKKDFESTHLFAMLILLIGMVVVISILALAIRMFYQQGDANLEYLERLKR